MRVMRSGGLEGSAGGQQDMRSMALCMKKVICLNFFSLDLHLGLSRTGRRRILASRDRSVLATLSPLRHLEVVQETNHHLHRHTVPSVLNLLPQPFRITFLHQQVSGYANMGWFWADTTPAQAAQTAQTKAPHAIPTNGAEPPVCAQMHP